MITLLEAAEAVGVSKSTMRRAVKEGKVSATRNEAGAFLIDPAELFRVFKPTPFERVIEKPMEPHEAPFAVQVAQLEAQVQGLKDLLEEVRQSRDEWKDQVTRLVHALPKPEDISSQKSPSLWKRLVG